MGSPCVLYWDRLLTYRTWWIVLPVWSVRTPLSIWTIGAESGCTAWWIEWWFVTDGPDKCPVYCYYWSFLYHHLSFHLPHFLLSAHWLSPLVPPICAHSSVCPWDGRFIWSTPRPSGCRQPVQHSPVSRYQCLLPPSKVISWTWVVSWAGWPSSPYSFWWSKGTCGSGRWLSRRRRWSLQWNRSLATPRLPSQKGWMPNCSFYYYKMRMHIRCAEDKFGRDWVENRWKGVGVSNFRVWGFFGIFGV